MTRTHYIILIAFALTFLAGCASLDVETKYGSLTYDGKKAIGIKVAK